MNPQNNKDGNGQTEHDRRVVKEVAEEAKAGLRRVRGQSETAELDRLKEQSLPTNNNKGEPNV